MTGVFVVVGVAATALVLFVIFRFRRRRTFRQRDHETTVAETLAEYGIGRQDLIEPDDHHPVNGSGTVTTPASSGNSADAGRTGSPNMSLSGINSIPVSAGGFGRHPHNPTYHADVFGQTYNPYTDNQGPHRHADPGPSDPGRIPNFSVPSGSGVVLPYFNHSQQDSMGSSEPLLGVNPDTDQSPEPAIPSVPPRNPLRVVEGTGIGNTPSDVDGRVNGGSSNDERTGYTDYDDEEYGALRKGSLKVCPLGSRQFDAPLTTYFRFETTRISLALLKRRHMRWRACFPVGLIR